MIYYKPFDKQLFSENDKIGRRNVIDMIHQKINVTLIPNPDKYGIDLLTTDKSIGVEVERIPSWLDEEFQYPTLHFLNRKVKFFKYHTYKKTYMIYVNKIGNRFLIIERQTLLPYIQPDKMQTMKCYTKNTGVINDSMFDVPIQCFLKIKIDTTNNNNEIENELQPTTEGL